MQIEYLRTAKQSLMIVKDLEKLQEGYEIQMLQNNKIPGLLSFQIILGDKGQEFWYSVTGMQTIERMFSLSPMKEPMLRRMLDGICNLKQQLENYLLDDRNVEYTVSRIFYDRSKEQLYFCYIPGLEKKTNSGISAFLEELLPYLDHTDQKCVRLGYGIYEASTQTEFSVEMCRAYMKKQEERISGEEEENVKKINEDIEQEDSGLSFLDSWQENEPKEYKKEWSKERKRGWKLPFGRSRKKKYFQEDDFFEERDAAFVAENLDTWKSKTHHTVNFSNLESEKVWELNYQGDGVENNITLETFPFVLGKESSRVQGVLMSDTVSRVHAKITEDQGRLYIEDHNSTNGTYVNGNLIPMNTPVEIIEGSRIVFATEIFVLKKCVRYNTGRNTM